MFGQTRRRRIVEPQQLAILGPICIDVTESAEFVRMIAEEQSEHGGLAQVRLDSEGVRVHAVLRFATYKLPVGYLPSHVCTGLLHNELARLRRSGFTPACAAEIVEGADGGFEVWLNHPEVRFQAERLESLVLQED